VVDDVVPCDSSSRCEIMISGFAGAGVVFYALHKAILFLFTPSSAHLLLQTGVCQSSE
jgi:hypothetical protein